MNNDLKAEGEAIAREAVSEFEKAVAEFVAAVAEKPEEAEVLPRLEAIYEAYLPRMEAFAARRKELTDPEVRGGFCSYVDEHRPKALFRMDQALVSHLVHYRMKPAPKVVEFLTTKTVALIEVAHNG